MAVKYPNTVKFVPTCSRPDGIRNAGRAGTNGRGNSIFERYLGKFNPPRDETMIYACGHSGMIASSKEKAYLAGWNFVEERFRKE